MFFDPSSRDLGLLITFTATCNGVSEGLRLISLFDKDYQKLWKPLDVRIYHDQEKDQVVHVEWSDAPVAHFCASYRGRTGVMRIEYTLEIDPSNSEAPLKNQVFLLRFYEYFMKRGFKF